VEYWPREFDVPKMARTFQHAFPTGLTLLWGGLGIRRTPVSSLDYNVPTSVGRIPYLVGAVQWLDVPFPKDGTFVSERGRTLDVTLRGGMEGVGSRCGWNYIHRMWRDGVEGGGLRRVKGWRD
jgi:hypothetical protein